MEAVKYMHGKGICHRDLKFENILVSGKNIKIVDFGFASDSEMKTRLFCGTPSFMAPEIVKKTGYYGS